MRDYETLRKELSYDREIAESLFHAQVALKRSRGGVVLNMEFGCEVEEISTLEEFKAALTRPGKLYFQTCLYSQRTLLTNLLYIFKWWQEFPLYFL